MSKDKGSIVRKLDRNGLISDFRPFAIETHYEVIMGSFAYGVSNDTSDVDVYGMFIPPIDHIFPHTAGHIRGFGPAPEKYDVAQKHHIQLDSKEYDLALYSITNYFQLCADNNPNMVDSLFVPENCVVACTSVGETIRNNRKLFLHKGIFHRMAGYAYSQLKKIKQLPSDNMKSLEALEGALSIQPHTVSINTLKNELEARGLLDVSGHNK